MAKRRKDADHLHVDHEHVQALLLSAEIGDVPTIDLHGLSTTSAVQEVEDFLYHEQWAGSEAVRIIHGRGTDALRHAVMKWLGQHPSLIAGFRDMTDLRFQQACLAVALHRLKRKTVPVDGTGTAFSSES